MDMWHYCNPNLGAPINRQRKLISHDLCENKVTQCSRHAIVISAPFIEFVRSNWFPSEPIVKIVIPPEIAERKESFPVEIRSEELLKQLKLGVLEVESGVPTNGRAWAKFWHSAGQRVLCNEKHE